MRNSIQKLTLIPNFNLMETTKILELLSYTLPAIVTGVIALYFFKIHAKNENNRRSFLLRKEKQTVALPLRLQAYERMALFLERISPKNLLVRVMPTNDDKVAYFKKLITAVEQEYEHNLAQQIYITSDCWNLITTAKNATLNSMRDVMLEGEIKTAKAMRQTILERMGDDEQPTQTAMKFVKEEVSKIF